MNWHLFATIAQHIQQPLTQSAQQVAGNILTGLRAPFAAAAAIYVAWTGYRIAFGQIAEPLRDVWAKLIRLAVVSFALTAAGYTQYVTDVFLTDLPQAIGRLITGGQATGPAAFDHIVNEAFTAGVAVMRSLSGWVAVDYAIGVLVIIYWLAAAAAIGFCFLIWLVAQVLLALLVAVGPFLIAMWLFPATRSLFERWIGAMAAALLLQAMTIILLQVLLGVIGAMLGDIAAPGANVYDQAFVLINAVILYVICALVLSQIPGAATSVAGGMQFHAGMLSRATFGNAAAGGQAALGYAGSAAKTGGQKAISGAGMAVNAIRTRLPPGVPLSKRGP